MKLRVLTIFGLVVASGALALCCADVPPPRASGPFFGPTLATEDPVAKGTGGASTTSARRGAAQPDGPGVPYPAEPKAPPPVPPPVGQGNSVKLQKYIVVDQFGYPPALAKVAVLVDPQRGWNAADSYTPGDTLELKKWSDGSTVFKGAVSAWKGGAVDERAGDRGSWFDFSSVRTPGVYYVFDAKNAVRSHPFEIAENIYRRVLKTALRMYYFNRANFEKKPPHSCVGSRCWSIGPDYLGPGQDREARSVRERDNPKTARDLSGGWWDAGDTNKYVTFSGGAVHPLLTAFEERAAAFDDDGGIPESHNGTPDLIDELLVEIRWLEKMQASDLKGGSLLKVGTVDYSEPTPDQSQLKRFYYPGACSSATITVAGVFAHAALVLSKLPGHAPEAAQLATRAKAAWDFFHANPKSESCDDGTIKSGDADASIADQSAGAVVAAIYLFSLTGDARYGDYVRKDYATLRPFQDDRFSVYASVQGDALLSYAALPNADPTVKNAILERKKSLAVTGDIYRFQPELDLYRAYMRADSYHWGSNSVRAAYGNTAYESVQYGLTSDATRASFVERAAGILHSFHGVNPMQLVYLTNMYADGGDACADETYHAWFRDKDPRFDNARTSTSGPAPGYLTGGPNTHYCEGQDPKQHACATSGVRDQPPEKAYVDSNAGWEPSNPYDRSWELTEPAIYYQAAYVRLLSKFVN